MLNFIFMLAGCTSCGSAFQVMRLIHLFLLGAGLYLMTADFMQIHKYCYIIPMLIYPNNLKAHRIYRLYVLLCSRGTVYIMLTFFRRSFTWMSLIPSFFFIIRCRNGQNEQKRSHYLPTQSQKATMLVMARGRTFGGPYLYSSINMFAAAGYRFQEACQDSLLQLSCYCFNLIGLLLLYILLLVWVVILHISFIS